MKVCIVSAKLPPEIDGIGDYSALLAERLASQFDVSVITSHGFVPTKISNVEIDQVFDPADKGSFWALFESVKSRAPDWIILQYNPFGFGHLGYNPVLPSVMAEIKKKIPGVRIALMVHEPCVPIESLKFAIMASWQRPQLKRLGETADVIFFSIEKWTTKYGAWFKPTPVYHLPVPSNLPRTFTDRQTSRAIWKVDENILTLGVFGSLHLSFILDRVKDSAKRLEERGIDFKILYVGNAAPKMISEMDGLPIVAGGPYPADEVSRRLPAVDIFLSPFVDGVSTRRGSLMASLQHGLATVGTKAWNTDTILLELDSVGIFLTEPGDKEGFNKRVLELATQPELRSRMGLAGQQAYDANFSWQSTFQAIDHYLSTTGHNGTLYASRS